LLEVTDLPSVNAGLNTISAVLLTAGYMLIRRRSVSAHHYSMVAAFVVSAAFLTSYLVYHAQVGHVSFQGTGWVRAVYRVILISHITLAITTVFLSVTTLYWALRRRFERHRRIARWTLPIWLYVSITGILVYWMLYRLGAE
jgi:putative membrane protein